MSCGKVDGPINVRYHEISREHFDALAAGGGGPEAIRKLAAAEHSKHCVLLRGVIQAAEATGTDQARFARNGRDVLDAVEHHDPHMAARTIGYPSVGAWGLRTVRALRGEAGAPGAYPATLAAVAAAAAVRSGLDAEVPVRPDAGIVCLPSLGVAAVEADIATVRSSGGQAEIRWAHGRVDIPSDPQRDAPGWHGVRRVRIGNFHVGIDDLDPFRMPAVAGLAPRLSARDADEWTTMIRHGWHLLAADHPDVAAEVAAAISVLVPLSRSPRGQLSSSSPDTFGAIAMSPPPDPQSCAVTLSHEVQHVKLGALLDIVDLTLPDDGRRYYAPWRADPRPVSGLLQGAYAYMGVTSFWQTRRRLAHGPDRLRADGEFALWRAGTAQVIETLLSSAMLTADGLEFVQHMSKTVTGWRSEPVSARARAFARRESTRHLAQWELDNGPVRT
jgi:HEXXH motif-containing protein